jgi:hypothetical protein
MALSELNRRRWRSFRRNGRAFWSLVVFSVLFVLAMCAEIVANDKPIVASYRGDLYFPAYNFYPETAFGGDFGTEAIYNDPAVKCLIVTGGRQECWDTPEDLIAAVDAGTSDIPEDEQGWMIWPPIPFHFSTINNVGSAPSAPDGTHWLGTDDTARDVLARVIYGFRISILFTLIVTVVASVVGIAAGAIQGYFGGRTDLVFHHPLRDPGTQLLALGLRHHPVRLAGACGRCPGGIPAGAELRICPRRPRIGCVRPHHHVPPHPAQCHGRHADHAAFRRDRHDQRSGGPGLPGLRPACIRAVAG